MGDHIELFFHLFEGLRVILQFFCGHLAFYLQREEVHLEES